MSPGENVAVGAPTYAELSPAQHKHGGKKIVALLGKSYGSPDSSNGSANPLEVSPTLP